MGIINYIVVHRHKHDTPTNGVEGINQVALRIIMVNLRLILSAKLKLFLNDNDNDATIILPTWRAKANQLLTIVSEGKALIFTTILEDDW